MEYINFPPFLTRLADEHKILYCISVKSLLTILSLYLISGFLRSNPSPEHGTSQITISATFYSSNEVASLILVFIILISNLLEVE